MKRYIEILSVDNRARTSQPRETRTPAIVKAVPARIPKNPFRKQKIIATKAKSVRRWLEAYLPEFIVAEDWPSRSPDLNPLDYRMRNALEQKACSKPPRNIDALQPDLVKAAASIPLEVVRGAIAE
ncbi:hypothetical protein Trydic_g10382 [Trypoxylus dichotomus]